MNLETFISGTRSDVPYTMLGLMFVADADHAISIVIDIMNSLRSKEDVEGVLSLLGALFGDRSRNHIGSALTSASVNQLEALVKAAYDHIDPHDDVHHEGTFEPDARDHAERARDRILGALLERPGQEAFAAMKRISLSKGNHDVKRFRELTRAKAERDAELAPWSEAEICDFERKGLAPAKSGEELFALAKGILDEIATDLKVADASSRPLLRSAENEEHVQLWLAEQLRLRAGGRYHVHREPIVAGKTEPDIVLTSTTATFQVAIEVKHGGKNWSGVDLRSALVDQLGGQYLRPRERHHGILVISHHNAKRRWQTPGTDNLQGFKALMTWLEAECLALADRGLSLAVCALDAA